MRTIKLWGFVALAIALASPAFAGDADTLAVGTIDALDANQGTGVQVNADNWDLHVDGWNLVLNGGASGQGSGAGIPFRDLDPDLQFEQVNREQDILYFLFQDDYGSVLSNWWAYGLRGGHNVTPP